VSDQDRVSVERGSNRGDAVEFISIGLKDIAH
jgi:hypothetical protein